MLFDKRSQAVLIAALCVAAAPVAAQTKTEAAAQDPVSDLLRARGEAYHRAPDSEQNPVEVKTTQALNAEITAQNDMAEAQEDADRRAAEAAQAQYQEQLTAAQADQARYDESVRAAEAAQLRYEQAMADWQATVHACEMGDSVRCAAGSKPPAPY